MYPQRQTWLHTLCEGSQSPVTAVKALISRCDRAQAGCSAAQPGSLWFSSTILSKVAVDRTDAEPHLQGGDTVVTGCCLKMAQGRQTGCLQPQRLEQAGGERAAGRGDKVTTLRSRGSAPPHMLRVTVLAELPIVTGSYSTATQRLSSSSVLSRGLVVRLAPSRQTDTQATGLRGDTRVLCGPTGHSNHLPGDCHNHRCHICHPAALCLSPLCTRPPSTEGRGHPCRCA